MARRKKKQPAAKTPLKLKIDKMVERLMDFYKMGRLANEEAATRKDGRKKATNTRSGKKKASQPTFADLAAYFGTAYETCRRAREFASRYRPAELKVLCRLRRPPTGLPFNLGYIPFLVTIPWATSADRKDRAAFQEEAAAGGWTVSELSREIRLRYPERRRTPKSGQVGGRKRINPPNAAAFLLRVASRSVEAARWCQWMSTCVPTAEMSKATAKKLREQLSAADHALKALVSTATEAAQQSSGSRRA
jgi:hypothetical protein